MLHHLQFLTSTSTRNTMTTTTAAMATVAAATTGPGAGNTEFLFTLEEQILQLADHEAWLDAQIRELEFANSNGERNALPLSKKTNALPQEGKHISKSAMGCS
jgi:cation transport regulator ChaC